MINKLNELLNNSGVVSSITYELSDDIKSVMFRTNDLEKVAKEISENYSKVTLYQVNTINMIEETMITVRMIF